MSIRKIDLSRKEAINEETGEVCRRHSTGVRRLKDIGLTGPSILEVTYSKHYSPMTKRFFNIDMSHIAKKGRRYTNRVVDTTIDLITEYDMTLDKASEFMKNKYFVNIPPTTIHDWVISHPCSI